MTRDFHFLNPTFVKTRSSIDGTTHAHGNSQFLSSFQCFHFLHASDFISVSSNLVTSQWITLLLSSYIFFFSKWCITYYKIPIIFKTKLATQNHFGLYHHAKNSTNLSYVKISGKNWDPLP